MSEEHLLQKHSVKLFGHGTSITLEKIFWTHLKAIAQRKNMTLRGLIESVDQERKGNLSSALRIFVLKEIERKPKSPIFPSFHEENIDF